MEINGRAFSNGQFDVAFHALAGALHWAQDAESPRDIPAVRDTSREQIGWIDAHQPGYSHSTVSAGRPGQRGIFTTLAEDADARIKILRSKERLHPKREG
jgi:hypothetical protein